jgi:hypothetical protein
MYSDLYSKIDTDNWITAEGMPIFAEKTAA